MAGQNLKANKMRSFLTMLGIIIGIMAIILITSVVAGAQSLITNQIQSIGSNLVGILPGSGGKDGPPAAVLGIVITTLKDSDAEAIKNQVSNVTAVSAYVTATETANYEGESSSVSIMGVSADYPLISDSKLTDGVFFTEDDKKNNSNVVVLGSKAKEDLFNGQEAIGQSLKIKKESFRVVGVFEERGSSGFQNVDNAVFIPVTTVQKKIVGIDHVGYIRVKINAEENVDAATDEITNLLRDRHNVDRPEEDDFTVSNVAAALEVLGTVTSALQLFLVAIAGIALIVGGIGIMNIMLAAVTERIREIGLRKAVGATRQNIIRQFLIETIMISVSGAIIGVALGVVISWIVALVVRKLGYDWDWVVSIQSIIFAVGFSVIIGLIFGVYPAKKAASLDPIKALHYE